MITSNDGIFIEADNFEYNKKKNLLKVSGNVVINDTIKNYKIFSDKAVYQRNEEIVYADGNSKAIDGKSREITANKITYKKNENKIFTEKNSKAKSINDNKDFSSSNVNIS